ncbi:alpha/beta fold hydrolase [Aureispira sp. CCB-QB1]|uniref:alpha/beta fold hydrolase n=1 Tax=Aureispira sp. CCB-QB1 TaxID=1313421 RepID=UPI00069886CE|nr:alpha/beta hydrolase [Aureispira sp. CCB-QB1]
MPVQEKKTTVYLLSGLGLDPNVFKHLTIHSDDIHHLKWLEPKKKESLESYALRMSEGIQLKGDNKLVLIGHSFGGVLMQEISKIITTDQIILISSIKAKKEKDAGMNFWMRTFPLHQLVTQKMVVNSFKSWGKKHGYQSQEAQAMFLHAAQQHSSYYFRWATSQIIAWESKDITTPIAHIHGTKDKTFAFKRIQPPLIAIEGGSHLMVFNKAAEVSQHINHILDKM